MMSPVPETSGSTVRAARALLMRLGDSTGAGAARLPDDILLFCYRLRDEYRIRRSTSKIISGPTFASLHEVLYQLESRPDETLASDEWRSYLEALLRDITSGAIVLARNNQK